MLSDAEVDLIRRNGLATLHDHAVVSPLSGEVFLQDGVLLYFDGRVLLVCAQPLRGAELHKALTRQLVRAFVEHQNVESLLYVGPEPLSLKELEPLGFFRHEVLPRRPRSAELFIVVRGAAPPPYRRALRNGFTARMRRGGAIDVRHLMLAEQFYESLTLSNYLAELAMTLPIIMCSPDVTIVEAWEQGTIRGFAAVHEPFEGISVGLFLAHDRRTAGVSDFLYAQLMQHASEMGSELLNVGPSVSRGHFLFKQKWHGLPLVPPYYCVTWRRRGVHSASNRAWLLRILSRRP